MPNTMNPEIKAQWTAALKSGDYRQGQLALSNDGKFCCLGVLCDLAVKAEVIPVATKGRTGDLQYGSEQNETYLPVEVMRWAGLADYNPRVELDSLPEGALWDCDPEDIHASLSNLNDNDTPFAVIAEIIEAQL